MKKIYKNISLLCLTTLMLAFMSIGHFVAATPVEENGLVIDKTAVANDDGTYTITLEAFATGESTITSTSKDKPADIILVLDQSSSMTNSMSFDGYREYGYDSSHSNANSNLYVNRHNGGESNLWYYNKEDGKYYSVSVSVTEDINYSKIEKENNSYYWQNRNNLYYKDGENYYKVEMDRKWNIFLVSRKYTYYKENGEEITNSTSTILGGKPEFDDLENKCLYLAEADETKSVYTYTYTVNGETKIIGTSTGASNEFTYGNNNKLFYTFSGSETRLGVLKSTVSAFVENVATRAKEDGVNHRIAIVGFASDDSTNNEYENTELFIGDKEYKYSESNNSEISKQYKNALQDMSTEDGVNNVKKSIDILDASGGTAIDLGTEMANSILDAYKNEKGASDRSKIVIVFTDGNPGIFTNDSNYTRTQYANRAISNTYDSKNTYGATVYTIGIFSGADASNINIATSTNSTDWSKNDVTNKFMHLMSSNFPKATSMSNTGTKKENLKGSYYLSASSSDKLNRIFTQISNSITSGGSSTMLSSDAVIRDIVTEQFEFPENANQINVYTAESNGSTTEWKTREKFTDANIKIDEETRMISVTNFSYKDNWCGIESKNGTQTFHDGKKLIIEFTVAAREEFLGGNDVLTNTSAAIYQNDTVKEPVMYFPQPTVNVPIKDITVTTTDKNVYLLDGMTADEIKNGTKVKVGADANGDGGVTIDLTQADYGLYDWQTAYVTIGVTYTDKDGNTVTNLTDLTDDTTYTVTVIITPTSNGTEPNEDGITAVGTPATAQTGNGEGTINVFKPELTYKDGQINNGDPVPSDDTFNSKNYVFSETVWKHGDTLSTSTDITMSGTAPTLSFKYHPEAEKVKDNKINTNTDKVAVDVKVYIGKTEDSEGTEVTAHVKFNHEDCTIIANCPDVVNGKFWLHILTTSLTITKTVNETVDDGQTFVFTVSGGGVEIPVVIHGASSVTIDGLKVGTTYTVTEDTSWSWRYEIDGENNQQITLGADKTKNDVTFNNTRTEEKWLDANAYADNKWSGQDDVALDTNNSYNATDTKKRRIS